MPEQMFRVVEVAQLLRLSKEWVRHHFSEIDGVLKVKSPAKRSRRAYTILLIPASVLDREVHKLARA